MNRATLATLPPGIPLLRFAICDPFRTKPNAFVEIREIRVFPVSSAKRPFLFRRFAVRVQDMGNTNGSGHG